jgi:predicted O-methyltransferase YrrM
MPFLADLQKFGEENQRLNVPMEHGRFLKLMVEASGAKRGLEVGTSNGFSAIWIALGLETTKGHLDTVEIVPERVAEAKENLSRAGLAKYVTCMEGDALKVLPDLEGHYDFVFIDALKQDYLKYLNLVLDRLEPGTVILAHNAVTQADAMRDYLDFVQQDPRFTTTIVHIEPRDGLAVSVYHGRED